MNNGVKSMGVLVEMVENMVELDVVQGAVWPIVHYTANDLGGPLGAGTIETDDEGACGTHSTRRDVRPDVQKPARYGANPT